MQSRALLPSWFGVGTAFDAFCQTRRDGHHPVTCDVPSVAVLQRGPGKSPARCGETRALRPCIARSCVRPPGCDTIFARIQAEHARTAPAICTVSGEQAALLENTPVLQRSIARRNPYVDPLNFIQVTLLRELRRSHPTPHGITPCYAPSWRRLMALPQAWRRQMRSPAPSPPAPGCPRLPLVQRFPPLLRINTP